LLHDGCHFAFTAAGYGSNLNPFQNDNGLL
jgi:hypothetical protein